MRTDNYGQMIFDEKDLCDLYLCDPERVIDRIITDKKITFPDILEINNKTKLIPYIEQDISTEDFDKQNQMIWFMPTSYQELDIAKYVLDQCKNEEELQRAGQELLLFQERDMFPLLQYLKYLVDTMRQNNIVWGVGRGSSVASFVLYLLGIHKINSLYYGLEISEFLK